MLSRNIRNTKKTWSIAFGVLLSMSINGCGTKSQGENSDKPKPEKLAPVETIKPLLDRPAYALTLPGELKPYEQTDLFAKARGFIKTISVDRGSRVEKGQVLAVLEAPEISQRFEAAKSDRQKFYEDYMFSRQTYERTLKAFKKDGSVAVIELDRAKSKFRSDSAAYASAVSNAQAFGQFEQYLKIIAPFDGIITERNFSVGALVGENNSTPLFVIAQNRKLRLTVAIPEKHTQALGQNTKAQFQVSNFPGKTFTSVLSRKSQVLEQQTRSVAAEFDVINGDGALDGGAYAQVVLQLQRRDSTLWVPTGSVMTTQSGTFVLVMENSTIRKVQVQRGISKGSLQEIFGSLTSTDLLIKTANEELLIGSQVKK